MGFARKVIDWVIFMDQGRIAEDCSKDDFFGKPEERSDRAKDFLSKILAHSGHNKRTMYRGLNQLRLNALTL
jgi:hypothetical protein